MAGSPVACSGAMYAGVPIDVPAWVNVTSLSSVRASECPRDVAEDAHDLVDRQRRAAREPVAEREPGHEGHGEVRHAARGPGGEDRNDVRLLQPGGQPNLAREAIGRHAGRELRRENLDDDLAAERRFSGYEYARHAATAELALESVSSAERRLQLIAEVHHACGERSP